jgi:hypothetical protein
MASGCKEDLKNALQESGSGGGIANLGRRDRKGYCRRRIFAVIRPSATANATASPNRSSLGEEGGVYL